MSNHLERRRRRIDPDGGRRSWMGRRAAHETFGVVVICDVKYALASSDDPWGAAMVQVRRRNECNAAVVVALVVPIEKSMARGSSILERAESLGHHRPIEKRPKRGLGEWVVVGDVRPAVALMDPEVQVQRGG